MFGLVVASVGSVGQGTLFLLHLPSFPQGHLQRAGTAGRVLAEVEGEVGELRSLGPYLVADAAHLEDVAFFPPALGGGIDLGVHP